MTVHDEKTLADIKAAGAMLGNILRELCVEVKAGVTAAQLDLLAEELIKKNGAIPVFLGYKPAGAAHAYPAALCISVNNEVVHGIPREDRILKEGDILSLDLGLSCKGYIVDAARTVIVGEGDADVVRLREGTREALDAAIAAAKPGNHTGDIGAAVSAVAKKYNLGVVRDLGGHGTGKQLHEKPYIANYGKPGEGDELREGMVLALEPIFTLGRGAIVLGNDGWTYTTKDKSRAAHFEDTILITKNGPEVLTR